MDEDFAGSLRERVGLEQWVDSRDESGGSVGFWRALGAVAAAVVPDGGDGGSIAEARRSMRRWRVTLRAGHGIGLTSRLVWSSRILMVTAVETDPRQPDRMVLRCQDQG